MDVFRAAQQAMRKTGELTTPDGLNHAELVNVVSEGVKQGIFESRPPTTEIEMTEHANSVANSINGQTMLQSVNDQSQLSAQLEMMSERMNQMQQMLLAPQHQQQQQQLQNTNTHQQQTFQNPYGWNPFMMPYPRVYPNQNPFQPGPTLQDITNLWNQRNNQRPNNNRRFNKYCWTHGGCAHNGKGCKNKAEGHKDNATFANKMGGSTKNCWT